MTKQAENFAKSLLHAGFQLLQQEERQSHGQELAATTSLPAEIRAEFSALHHYLGGNPQGGHFTSGRWDFVCADGLLIEYDEELHFNRFRHETLRLSWSQYLPWAARYLEMSRAHEDACKKAGSYGGKWSNDSCDRMFGGSDSPGVMFPRGPSRWKQRAVYDAVKDAYAWFTPGVSLARVSMYDIIGGVQAGTVLKKGPILDSGALREHVFSSTVPSLT